MGVDVVLRLVERLGTNRRRFAQVEIVLDRSDRFARSCALADRPTLNRVDPYRTLVLTAADMPGLVADLDAVAVDADKPDREVLADIRRLARRCAAGESMELHLEGD
ncbi:hypothetical protein [Actinokineospora enzanensis]|uniref:hypothetical protein n=1 Tax=Actinokineospora enzanensis TaxID=155975 RepID=UPI0003624D0B|nr:hypothetical protein [Actinokineospora enzanensis]